MTGKYVCSMHLSKATEKSGDFIMVAPI
jgi:hypothetical protein